MNIELRNIKKKITGYTIVSPEDYNHLNQFKWYKDKDGYVIKGGNDNIISRRMHRYIMIKILKHELTSKNLIDHINNNPLDNKRENLRIATHSENARNRKKLETSSSKYFGVTKTIKNFSVKFIVDKYTILYAYYNNEIHAAYQYNLWAEKYNINCTNKNNIEIPNDFIEYKKIRIKNIKLPIGITLSRNKFRIQPRINKKYLTKYYDTLEQAQFELNKILRQEKIRKIEQIFKEPIKRNEKNQCIIELFNKKKEKVGETIVDENIYYLLKIFPINLSKNKVNISIIDYDSNRKNMFLSRFIMNYNGKNFIDHINNNPLDNRKCNLRIVTPEQNSMNRKSKKNSSSKYIGVSKSNKKWMVEITFKGKKIYLGTFDNEIEAAKVRDIATKKYFGEYGNLNFPGN